MEQKFCNIKGSEDCPHNCGNALLSWGDNECRLFSPRMALQATRKAARGCQLPFVRGTRFFLRNVDDPLPSLCNAQQGRKRMQQTIQQQMRCSMFSTLALANGASHPADLAFFSAACCFARFFCNRY